MGFLGRMFASFVMLALVSVALFALVRAIPVSPARVVLGPDATEADILRFDHDHGLDLPLATQYLNWVGGMLRGDFGRSYADGAPIGPRVAATFPITMELVVFGFLFALVVAIPLGIVSAYWEDGWIDHLARLIAVIGASIPGFWLGLMLIGWFAVALRWLPPGGYVPVADGLAEHLRAMVLPTVAVGFYYVAIISRMTRSSVSEALGQDYVRTARAMGLGRGRIMAYVLKNALSPVVTVSAMSFGYMFGWALIIEQVFNFAGMSRALLSAIFQRDYLMVEAIVLVITAIFLAANLVADGLYRLLNPRVAR
jgi:peptide/nickel transport system permease protein